MSAEITVPGNGSVSREIPGENPQLDWTDKLSNDTIQAGIERFISSTPEISRGLSIALSPDHSFISLFLNKLKAELQRNRHSYEKWVANDQNTLGGTNEAMCQCIEHLNTCIEVRKYTEANRAIKFIYGFLLTNRSEVDTLIGQEYGKLLSKWIDFLRTFHTQSIAATNQNKFASAIQDALSLDPKN